MTLPAPSSTAGTDLNLFHQRQWPSYDAMRIVTAERGNALPTEERTESR